MKHLKAALAAVVVPLAMTLPSIALAQYHESRLDNFLDNHPHVKSELSRNPDLIFNKQYRRSHPELQKFMQDHPNIYGKLHNHDSWGEYSPDHQWHEADWWHEHDPDWMYSNDPEWAKNHRDWDDDGDFDEDHHWHSRDWWEDHRADWIRHHHPEWDKHRAHEEAQEEEWEEKHGYEAVEANEHKHGHHGYYDHDGH